MGVDLKLVCKKFEVSLQETQKIEVKKKGAKIPSDFSVESVRSWL